MNTDFWSSVNRLLTKYNMSRTMPDLLFPISSLTKADPHLAHIPQSTINIFLVMYGILLVIGVLANLRNITSMLLVRSVKSSLQVSLLCKVFLILYLFCELFYLYNLFRYSSV